MKTNYKLSFQIATIFIGTIVGAGLSSGKEISQFFSQYGIYSFIGIFLCGLFYIWMSTIIINISSKYNLTSYDSFIALICPGFLGTFTNLVITFFFYSSTAIVIAGSGALINQYFSIPTWSGILFMVFLSILFLLRETDGLIEINGFIVPSLIIIMVILFISFIITYPSTSSISYLNSAITYKKGSLFSTILYAGFNIMSCVGVLVPLSTELNDNKSIIVGVSIGSLFLTLLCSIINFLMIVTYKYSTPYEIPLLFIAKQISPIIQFLLLCIIWLEMFSSKVSNIYSLSKGVENHFKISYKKSIFIIIALSLPVTKVGFGNLVTTLYPLFGGLSIVFVYQCISFYYFKMKKQHR